MKRFWVFFPKETSSLQFFMSDKRSWSSLHKLQRRGEVGLQNLQHVSQNSPQKRDPIGCQFAIKDGMTFRSDPLVRLVIGCGIEVHRHLGPGLLEPAYRPCLAWELKDKGIAYRTEVTVPVRYKGVVVDCAYRVDFLVEDWLVLELKSVERIIPVHVAQVATYLRLLNSPQGLIMNFNVPRLKDGIKSVLAREAVVDESPLASQI